MGQCGAIGNSALHLLARRVVVSMADLLFFMEKRLNEFEKRGDRERSEKLRKIIREYKRMLDEEQITLSCL